MPLLHSGPIVTCSKIPFSRIGHVQLFLFIPGRMHVSIHNCVRIWNYKHVACSYAKKHSQEMDRDLAHTHIARTCFLSHDMLHTRTHTHTHTHACIALEHTIRVLRMHINTHMYTYTVKLKGWSFLWSFPGLDKSSGTPFSVQNIPDTCQGRFLIQIDANKT